MVSARSNQCSPRSPWKLAEKDTKRTYSREIDPSWNKYIWQLTVMQINDNWQREEHLIHAALAAHPRLATIHYYRAN